MRTVVTGSIPAQTIVQVSEVEDADMIMLTSRGRGGMDIVLLGSVAQQVVLSTPDPVFIMPILALREDEEMEEVDRGIDIG